MTEPFRDTTYGLGLLGQGSIGVLLKCSSNEEPFDPAYYNGSSAVFNDFSQEGPIVDRVFRGFTEV